MATTTAAKAGNPKAATDLNLAPSPSEDISSTQQLPAPLTGGGDDDGKNGALAPADVKTSDVDGGGAATDIQKKMKRAERFGMPVHLSEEEKRSSRAERFGTVSAVGGLDSSKHSEDLKRKARAERFGIVKSVSADEEAKKKARLARFGTAPAPAPAPDSAEEDKKKARALRFSEPKSSPKANGDGKIETKTVISGKAGGGT